MKKCSSCSKDLPDAALHCVFCGAKQAPAPAQAAGLAKTVMGSFSAQEMLAQMRQHGVPAATPGSAPVAATTPFAPAPMPAAAPAPIAAPPPATLSPALVPVAMSSASARTMFDVSAAAQPNMARGGVDATLPPRGAPAPGPAASAGAWKPPGSFDATLPPQGAPAGIPQYGGAAARPNDPQGLGIQATLPASPQAAPVFGPSTSPPGASPMQMSPASAMAMPVAAQPAYSPPAQPAYAAPAGVYATPPQTAATDPTNLRLYGILFGVLLIASFCDPSHLTGALFDAPTSMLVPLLIPPVVGLLSVIVALLPLGSARGAIIGLLAGGALGYTMRRADWHVLVGVGGTALLLTGLVMRAGYPRSLFARILVTLGALGAIAPMVIPVDAGVPIVFELTKIGELDMGSQIGVAIQLLLVVLALASLLAWLPAPASGAAGPLWWLLLGLPLVARIVAVVLGSHDDLSAALLRVALPGVALMSLLALFSRGWGAVLGRATA